MKRNPEQMSKNENEKRRSGTSTPKNPQKKQKNDEEEMKAKRQINFKPGSQSTDSSNKSFLPVNIRIVITNPYMT